MLQVARDTLAGLGDYEEAPALVKAADYTMAGLYLEAEDTDNARPLYLSVGDYENALEALQ